MKLKAVRYRAIVKELSKNSSQSSSSMLFGKSQICQVNVLDHLKPMNEKLRVEKSELFSMRTFL